MSNGINFRKMALDLRHQLNQAHCRIGDLEKQLKDLKACAPVQAITLEQAQVPYPRPYDQFHMVLTEAQFDAFCAQLEANPIAANEAVQRLLDRSKPWAKESEGQ